jgi:hypothetical protein
MTCYHSTKDQSYSRLLRRAALALILALFIQGCDPISLTLFGIGTATGVSYSLSGYAYKTFTAPMQQVHDALLAALLRMGIIVEKTDKTDTTRTITARTADREIEIVLEAISARATRIKTVTRKDSVFKDRATATEIILQTEKALVGTK